MVAFAIGLWIEGRGEYRREYDKYWTDHTVFPIQVAGMLSMPVAAFAAPLYPLAQGGVSRAGLLGWLLAVAVLWAYIGWRFDNRGRAPFVKSPYRQIIGAVLTLFGIVLLLSTVQMFHVGLVYKAVGLVWVVAILRHSFHFFKAPMKQAPNPSPQ